MNVARSVVPDGRWFPLREVRAEVDEPLLVNDAEADKLESGPLAE
jgi:hypothetical protein